MVCARADIAGPMSPASTRSTNAFWIFAFIFFIIHFLATNRLWRGATIEALRICRRRVLHRPNAVRAGSIGREREPGTAREVRGELREVWVARDALEGQRIGARAGNARLQLQHREVQHS